MASERAEQLRVSGIVKPRLTAQPAVAGAGASTGAGAGRGFVNPPAVDPNASRLPDIAQLDGVVYKRGNSYSGKNIAGDIASINDRGSVRDARGGMLSSGAADDISAIGTGTPAQIEQRALAIERQNSALRRAADAYGPGAHNADGSGGAAFIGSQRQADINKARDDRGTGAFLAGSSLNRNATEGRARIAAADKTLAELGQQSAVEAGERNSARSSDVQSQQIQATERGQDIAAQTQAGNSRNALDIARMQQQTQRDVATLGADSRVAAAEARAVPKLQVLNLPDSVGPDGYTPIKGGQVLYNAQTGEIVRPTPAGQPPVAPKPAAIAYLKANPKTSAQFDAEYGPGASKLALGR